MTFRLCIVAVTLAAIGFGASRLNRHNRAKGERAERERVAALHTTLVVVATPDVAARVFDQGPDNGGTAA